MGLGEHQCYVKLSMGGEPLPTFSVQLDPPPRIDRAESEQLVRASAARYGRERAAVERDLRSALARIEASHPAPFGQGAVDTKRRGAPSEGIARKERPARNEHRRGKPGKEAYPQRLAGLGEGGAGRMEEDGGIEAGEETRE